MKPSLTPPEIPEIPNMPVLLRSVSKFDRIQANYLAAMGSYYYTPNADTARSVNLAASKTISASRIVLEIIAKHETSGTFRSITNFVVGENIRRRAYLGELTCSILFTDIAAYQEDLADWLEDKVLDDRGDYAAAIDQLTDTVLSLINYESATLHEQIGREIHEYQATEK